MTTPIAKFSTTPDQRQWVDDECKRTNESQATVMRGLIQGKIDYQAPCNDILTSRIQTLIFNSLGCGRSPYDTLSDLSNEKYNFSALSVNQAINNLHCHGDITQEIKDEFLSYLNISHRGKQ